MARTQEEKVNPPGHATSRTIEIPRGVGRNEATNPAYTTEPVRVIHDSTGSFLVPGGRITPQNVMQPEEKK